MHVFDRSDEPARPSGTGFADHRRVSVPGPARARDERRREPARRAPEPVAALLALVGSAELTVADVLRHLVDRAEEELAAADAVLATVRRRGGGREVVASDELARGSHELQLGLREGPVLDAVAEGQPVVSGDLPADPRWPRLGGALGTLGVRSALCVPLRLADGAAGTLCAYAAAPGVFDDRARRTAARLADPAGRAVDHALVLEQTRRLVVELHLPGTDRRAVEEAVAVLMEENGVGAEEALAVLQMLGRTEDEDVASVARAVVAARTGIRSAGGAGPTAS